MLLLQHRSGAGQDCRRGGHRRKVSVGLQSHQPQGVERRKDEGEVQLSFPLGYQEQKRRVHSYVYTDLMCSARRRMNVIDVDRNIQRGSKI